MPQTPVGQSPRTVLDAPQIAALNKRNLAGLLQTVPGLLVEEQGGPGGLTAVSVVRLDGTSSLVRVCGLLYAAWMAVLGAGMSDDWSGVTAFVSYGDRVEPNPATAELYDEGYRRFRESYEALARV